LLEARHNELIKPLEASLGKRISDKASKQCSLSRKEELHEDRNGMRREEMSRSDPNEAQQNVTSQKMQTDVSRSQQIQTNVFIVCA
jgi:hypothetical protein